MLDGSPSATDVLHGFGILTVLLVPIVGVCIALGYASYSTTSSNSSSSSSNCCSGSGSDGCWLWETVAVAILIVLAGFAVLIALYHGASTGDNGYNNEVQESTEGTEATEAKIVPATNV